MRSHTYNTAGNYTAALTVTDNTGLKGTRIVTITAHAVTVPMHVSAMGLAIVSSNRGWRASGTATVPDSSGRAVPGAVVTGT